jgi:OmpA-OmpF porin, OOP family
MFNRLDMKKSCIHASLLLLLTLATTLNSPLRAQSITGVDATTVGSTKNRPYDGNVKMNTWSVSFTPMLTRFQGDLSPGAFQRGPNAPQTLGFGLSLNKQLSNIFGASVNFHAGKLAGGKTEIYNAYFRSSYLQGTVQAQINLKSLLLGTKVMKRWKWDVYGGVGYMWFDTQVYDLTTNQLLRYSNDRLNFSSVTQGKWEANGSVFTREFVFPIGSAIHYELTPRLDLGIDYMFNNVNTEKLDMTVGSTDPNYNLLPSNIYLFRKGTSKLDKWMGLGVSLTYKLGKNAISVGKDRKYDASKGRYHLRWTAPDDLLKAQYNPTMNDADSIAKANMPKPTDPRLYTDSDNDGVADLFDKEPQTPQGSVVSGAGVAMNLDSIITSLLRSKFSPECENLFSNIEFDTDKATIRPASQETLKKVVELLNIRTNCRIVLTGHTDARASYGYNVQLSKRRVDAAKRFLVRAGLTDPSRVTIEYYGEYRPVAENTTTPGLQANRRVEIKIAPMSDLRSKYPAGFRLDDSEGKDRRRGRRNRDE